jgi:hypothetical protein
MIHSYQGQKKSLDVCSASTMNKTTTLPMLIVVALLAISVTLAIVQQQQSGQTRRLTTSTNQSVNFVQLFEQKFAASSYLGTPGVSVVYQSSTTVILQGHTKTLNTKIVLVNNHQIWQGVEIVAMDSQ